MPLAKEIRVDRDENGAPRITIDGQVLPWFTAGIKTPSPSLEEMPTITVTIPAEKIVMENGPVTPARQYLAKVSGGMSMCSHPGCIGAHTTRNEKCC